MRRSMAVLVGMAVLLVLPAEGALAGGGSWLQTERRSYAVGDHAVAQESFFRGSLQGRVSDGPFYAYLVAEDRPFRTPGRVPDHAVPLGEMTITLRTESDGDVCCWVARVAFTVPDVPPGVYRIQYCNDPCTVDGIGDLMGGSLAIAASVREAQLTRKVDRLRDRVRQFRRSAERHRADARDRAEALAAADQDARHYRAWAESLQETLAAREAALRDADRPLVPGWGTAAIAGILALLSLALLRWRRGSGAKKIPETPDEVSAELLEWVGQVPDRQPTTSSGRPGMVRASPGLSAGSSPVTKS